nr:hypothetical protein [Aspergillus sp.]
MCDGIWTKPPFPSLPNLKTIRITHSRISAEDLEGLLLSCNGLRSFTYESCGPYIPRVWWADGPSGNYLKPLDVVRHLRRHRETLKSLHLDWRRREASPTASGDVHFDRPEPVIDFRDFTGLQHLFLNASEFYDSTYQEPPPLTQRLPHSITSLQFAADMRCSVPRLSNGMLGLAGALSEGHFPNLKEVTCDAENRLDNEPLVSPLFAAAGVEFGYDSWPMSEATLNLPSDMPPIPDFYECYLREDTSQLPLPDEEDADLM